MRNLRKNFNNLKKNAKKNSKICLKLPKFHLANKQKKKKK